MAVEEGKDTLVMHLCKDTVPENQEFILHEVSECATLCHPSRSVRERGSQACSLTWSQWVSYTGNLTLMPGGDYRVSLWLLVTMGLSSLSNHMSYSGL